MQAWLMVSGSHGLNFRLLWELGSQGIGIGGKFHLIFYCMSRC